MTKKPEVLALIPARGGSKGVPRKNIRLLAGLPLIAHSIRAAMHSPSVTRVVVSTDDAEIAQVAQAHGAEVPFMRPAHLAQDRSSEWQVWQHALEFTRAEGRFPEVFVCVSPTSPLRATEDIERAVEELRRTGADLVFAVTQSHRNPWYNMVTLDANGRARLVNVPEGGALHGRQSAPPTFDMTTVVYAARPEFVLRANSMWEGVVGGVQVPIERAIDIDTEFDFSLAEFMMGKREERRA